MSRHNEIMDSFDMPGGLTTHTCLECGAMVSGEDGMYRHYAWHESMRHILFPEPEG